MQQPRTIAVPLDLAKLPAKEQERIANETRQALIANAHLIARINFVNQKKNDRYMELLLENRSDLAGLPFTMGDACRLQKKERRRSPRRSTWSEPGCARIPPKRANGGRSNSGPNSILFKSQERFPREVNFAAACRP